MDIKSIIKLLVMILGICLTIMFAVKVFLTQDKDKLLAASILTVICFGATVALTILIQ